jgi:poly(hydroxyalkanoate) granule-associated protein
MTARKSPKSARRAATPRRARRSPAPVTLVDAVHQIWLAGLGALARAQKDGPRALESIISDGAQLVDRSRTRAEDTLREAVATVQGALEEQLRDGTARAAETWDGLERMFQARVQQALRQVGVPNAADVQALTARVDALNASVDALARSRARRAAPARRARRTERRQAPAARA